RAPSRVARSDQVAQGRTIIKNLRIWRSQDLEIWNLNLQIPKSRDPQISWSPNYFVRCGDRDPLWHIQHCDRLAASGLNFGSSSKIFNMVGTVAIGALA